MFWSIGVLSYFFSQHFNKSYTLIGGGTLLVGLLLVCGAESFLKKAIKARFRQRRWAETEAHLELKKLKRYLEYLKEGKK